jgi:hypothetical protein
MNLATTVVVRLLVTVLAIAAIAGQVAHINALSGTADFIIAPEAPLTLQDARVMTHQFSVRIPIR